MKPERGPLMLLTLAAFLAPIMGGGLPLEGQSLAAGDLLPGIFRGDSAVAQLSQAVLLSLAMAAGLWSLATHKVLTVPHARIAIPLALMASTIILSVFYSGYRFQSIGIGLQWIGMIGVLVVTLFVAGRDTGPRWLIAALAAGCAVVALFGVREYATQIDPNWRIFSLWLNPNALAGILIVGQMTSLGVMLFGERLAALLGGLGATLCTTALFLTSSDGGIAAFAVGLLVTLILLIVWRTGWPPLIGVLAAIGIGFGLFLLLQQRQQAPVSPSTPSVATNAAAPDPAVNRLMANQATATQSVGFRALLYRGAWELIQRQPFGYGIGTYKHHSAKPGLTTITQTAHNSFLQIGVEAGVIAMLSLVVLGALVLFELVRGSAVQPTPVRQQQAILVGALVAMAAHNFIDSDLYHVGSGFALFLLLGVGLLMAADGVGPELAAPGFRESLGVLGVGGSLGLFYVGHVEAQHAHLNFDLSNNPQGIVERAEGLIALAPADPRGPFVRYQLARLIGQDPGTQADYLRRAIQRGPTPAMHRQLARLQTQLGDLNEARLSIQRALQLDPNNLPALRQWLDLESDNPDARLNVARRLVDVEATPYFQVRSIPEVVPTQTYDARLILAEAAPLDERQALLDPALNGYAEYARVTVPNVVRFARTGMGGFAGEDVAKASEAIERAFAALELYRALPGTDPQRSTDLARAFGSAREALSSSESR